MIASAPAVVLGQTFFFPHLPGEGLSRVLRLMSALFRAMRRVPLWSTPGPELHMAR